MKELGLRANATCGLCHNKIGACGILMFYRVRIERHFVKLDVVQRQSGLEMMLGGHVRLAQVMGTDEEMTEQAMNPIEFTVCEACSTDFQKQRHCIASLVELVEAR
jgi:hypothetical protein